MKISILAKKNYKEIRQLHENFDVVKKGDICIAIGGDGTFLKALKTYDVPILAVRDGSRDSVGYHSDVALSDIGRIIKKLKSKEYKLIELAKRIEIGYKNRRYFAVNEARMNNEINEVSFFVYKIENGKREPILPFSVSGDGLIVTGTVGSTAYNKAAGGPIILSQNVLCMTFINVDGPYRNPIIFDANTTLEIQVTKYPGTLMYDSSRIGRVSRGDKFRVKMSGKSIRIVKLNGVHDMLSDKLERIIKSKINEHS